MSERAASRLPVMPPWQRLVQRLVLEFPARRESNARLVAAERVSVRGAGRGLMLIRVSRYWINTDAITYVEELNHDEIALHLLNGLPSGTFLTLRGEARSRFLASLTRLEGFYDTERQPT